MSSKKLATKKHQHPSLKNIIALVTYLGGTEKAPLWRESTDNATMETETQIDVVHTQKTDIISEALVERSFPPDPLTHFGPETTYLL